MLRIAPKNMKTRIQYIASSQSKMNCCKNSAVSRRRRKRGRQGRNLSCSFKPSSICWVALMRRICVAAGPSGARRVSTTRSNPFHLCHARKAPKNHQVQRRNLTYQTKEEKYVHFCFEMCDGRSVWKLCGKARNKILRQCFRHVATV